MGWRESNSSCFRREVITLTNQSSKGLQLLLKFYSHRLTVMSLFLLVGYACVLGRYSSALHIRLAQIDPRRTGPVFLAATVSTGHVRSMS